MADQQTDISALPIDKQMEHILRSRLDVQELVSPPSHAAHSEAAATDTDRMRPLLLLLHHHHQKITDISANCGNSFSVVVVSKDFEKKTTLARHRLSKFPLVSPPPSGQLFPPLILSTCVGGEQ